jgi:hypothetical protein
VQGWTQTRVDRVSAQPRGCEFHAHAVCLLAHSMRAPLALTFVVVDIGDRSCETEVTSAYGCAGGQSAQGTRQSHMQHTKRTSTSLAVAPSIHHHCALYAALLDGQLDMACRDTMRFDTECDECEYICQRPIARDTLRIASSSSLSHSFALNACITDSLS